MTESKDLFGNFTGPDQLSMFGEGEHRMPVPVTPAVDHPTRARAKLTAVLETARRARRMPWSERDARMWQTVFPQMANWLPDDEAEQLTLAFRQEMDRLKAA
ncbi:hypothetical protein [Caulobacter sp. NIBR1757]|uniref:hypothetical protein n=1 Tax=Caulobacter sp. NIBR1757 TaxID=3016000 RepID=UPI0022F0CEA7|nr:hypothetical protein [Caulobacter sp. NIBR1757]